MKFRARDEASQREAAMRVLQQPRALAQQKRERWNAPL
jgi:hypothetical protein